MTCTYVSTSHVTHTNESWHVYTRVMSCIMTCIWMRRVTCTYQQGMHMVCVWWSHVIHMNESCHVYGRVMSCVTAFTWVMQGMYVNESWCVYEQVLSYAWSVVCVWTRHVIKGMCTKDVSHDWTSHVIHTPGRVMDSCMTRPYTYHIPTHMYMSDVYESCESCIRMSDGMCMKNIYDMTRPYTWHDSFMRTPCKQPYKRDLHSAKRPIILRSLLIVATPYLYEGVMASTWSSRVTYMDESWHVYECVTACIWMRHVTYMNAWRDVYDVTDALSWVYR